MNCPACKYNIGGMGGQPVCPECGSHLRLVVDVGSRISVHQVRLVVSVAAMMVVVSIAAVVLSAVRIGVLEENQILSVYIDGLEVKVLASGGSALRPNYVDEAMADPGVLALRYSLHGINSSMAAFVFLAIWFVGGVFIVATRFGLRSRDYGAFGVPTRFCVCYIVGVLVLSIITVATSISL